ncbi:MAG: amylo-alpha-1,6-glucosidase [Planctomycetota bacterium]
MSTRSTTQARETMQTTEALPEPITIDCTSHTVDQLEALEWLVTNRQGSYACSTVLGANTRRYHGLLVAATLPPVGRQVVLSLLGEEVRWADRTMALSSFQFVDAVSPDGHRHLKRFVNDVAPTWIFADDDVTITRQLALAQGTAAVAVRYRLDAPHPVTLRVRPFAALRDFHALRRAHEPHKLRFSRAGDGVRIEDLQHVAEPVWIAMGGARFVDLPQWWYRFLYRQDVHRGQEGLEDLYTPGYFELPLPPGTWMQLTAACDLTGGFDFDANVNQRRGQRARLAAAVAEHGDEATRRLAAATDDFVVTRHTPAGPSTTILAGYPWFADWGRDTFIALTGLLLLTERFDRARQVLSTFAAAVTDGIVPNRFDDYSGTAHYNSIDASLWFVLAVDRYIRATGDEDSWSQRFAGPVRTILEAYHDGTHFNIHADADGLLAGGDANTQLTWMDVKYAGEAITPRHGKAVEVNALWLEALHIMADRSRGVDAAAADHYGAEAVRVAAAFANAFWFAEGGYLYDCLTPDGPDGSLRPNQVIALAQPHCPLSPARQKQALDVVIHNLLTPVGLRTLAPSDVRYRHRYGGSWESRDRAYHQGAVWPWLMGPMVQAYLRVHQFSDEARHQAGIWLAPLDDHLAAAGLGTISEIFDGDPPHWPRGCIAQAWSVAEVLRARRMVQLGHLL